MTCIKTGARVLIEPYNRIVAADIYQVDGVRIARTYPFDEEVDDAEGLLPHIEPNWCLRSVPGGQREFWRPDLGVFVVPAEYLQPIAYMYARADRHQKPAEGET